MYKQKHHPTAIRAQSIPPKPKRPLTIFNLFGKLERSLILQSAQSLIPLSSERSIREDAASKNKVDPYLELRPERYRYIALPYDWFKVGKNRAKRQDHQTHGLIKFQDMSKVVAKSWDEADDETRNFCQTVYARELAKYYEDVKGYIELYGKAAHDSQKRTYKKRKSEDDTSPTKNSHSPKKPAAEKDKSTKKDKSASSSASPLNQLGNAYIANLDINPYQNSSQAGNSSNLHFYGDELSTAIHHSYQVYRTCPTNAAVMQYHRQSSITSPLSQLGNAYIANLDINPYQYPNQTGNASNLYFYGHELSTSIHHSNQQDMVYRTCPNNAGGSGCIAMRCDDVDSRRSTHFGSYIPVSGPHENSDVEVQKLLRHDHLENQIAVPAMRITTHQAPFQSYAASFGQQYLGASNQYYAFDEGSRVSNQLQGHTSRNLSLTHTVNNPIELPNLMPQVQNQASFQPEHFWNHIHQMYSLMNTNEPFADQKIAAKPDNTNVEGDFFDNDTESDISLALVGDDFGSVLCGEELLNCFDSEWELDW